MTSYCYRECSTNSEHPYSDEKMRNSPHANYLNSFQIKQQRKRISKIEIHMVTLNITNINPTTYSEYLTYIQDTEGLEH